MIRIKAAAAALLLSLCTILFTAACSDKSVGTGESLSPKETVQKIFTLAAAQDYNDLAGYCRSFSPYSVELYFSDTGDPLTKEQTEKYSDLLYKLFDSYVTYSELTETLDYDTRVGVVTGKFTSVDLDKLGEKTDPDINNGLKNDFDAQMAYLETVIGDESLASKTFTLDIEFRYMDKQWVIADKNFLLLLTLGYYKGR